MITLNDDERDAVKECFNIGIGTAAASLSEMVGQEVALSVPEVDLVMRSELADHVDDLPDPVSGVRQTFGGPLSGHALLIFPHASSLELVRLLIKDDISLEFLTEMEQEALVEVGNIILNACLASVASVMRGEIMNEIPEPVQGALLEVLDQAHDRDEDSLLRCRMAFSVSDNAISGNILFFLDTASLDAFRQSLTCFFEQSA